MATHNLSFKKVIILSPAHPLRGGIAASSERLAQELHIFGADIEIISFSLQYPRILFPGKTQFTDDPPPENLIIKSQINSINPLNWLEVGNRIKRMKPDLIIVRYWLPFMGPSLGTIARIARKNRHSKVIAITDNVIPHEKRPGDRQLTSYFVNSVDAFIVMSKSVGEDLRQFTAAKLIDYSPHPIYDSYGEMINRTTALEHLKLPTDKSYILFFGFIRKYKGLDLLLEALTFQEVRDLDVKLIVAGEFYDDAASYQTFIQEHHLEENVILYNDFIPNEQVKYYFGAVDLIAQPYRTATQSGISQMAFHFEKPMIVTNVGGLPEIVMHEKEGYVVNVDAEAIAKAIVDFYKQERKGALEKGVQLGKKRYSWDKMVENIDALYKKIING